ncbi:MAG: undecaprenyl/decaprenyl-phosphate alpha-N-acetylglucosaminyl 1-phosphate transferase [Pirellulales bacterium]|nr:undecaprenyl/decaprenyl-phosphate alpha-N-acetylglucosaminyl 1-phosphate transferase [Pirellulales bacterium]
MIGPIISLGIAVCTALLLTPVVGRVAQRWQVVDRPDGRRKLHHNTVPLWGGVGVYLGLVLGLLAAGSHCLGEAYADLAWAVALAAGIACVFGCIDDAFCLRARYKLALQTLSVLPIVLVGYYVDRVVAFGYQIDLGWLGIPLTVFWLLGCINALNLMDGMDGLASVIGLSTAGMMGLIAANEGHPHVAVIALVLGGALVGFLVHNRPPARIFLGDSGSMVLGLTVGVLGMQGALKTSATLSLTAPVVVMALPMFDVVAAVVRRTLSGRPVSSPDRKHIHHRLLDRGLNPWQVLCILGACCLMTGGAATFATIFRKDALAWITALTLVVLLIRMRLFGHHEFSMLRQSVRERWASVQQWGQTAVRSFRARLEENRHFPLDQVWNALIENAKAWDIQRLEIQLSSGVLWGRRCWIDPRFTEEKNCRWSVVVAMQEEDGRRCEFRVTGSDSSTPSDRLDLFTAQLRAFGAHICRHVAETDWLPLLEEVHFTPILHTEPQRKAA